MTKKEKDSFVDAIVALKMAAIKIKKTIKGIDKSLNQSSVKKKEECDIMKIVRIHGRLNISQRLFRKDGSEQMSVKIGIESFTVSSETSVHTDILRCQGFMVSAMFEIGFEHKKLIYVNGGC